MIGFLIGELNVCGGTHKQLLKLLDYTEQRGSDFFVLTRKLDYRLTYPEFKHYENRIRLFPTQSLIIRFLDKLKIFPSFVWERKYLKMLTKDADVINVHDTSFEMNFDLFNGKKLIWQVNDLPWYCGVGVGKFSKSNMHSKVLFSLLRKNIRYVQEITVNVGKNADRIKELFGRNAHVFYCGISPIQINKELGESLKRFRNKKINLLSSGVFLPYRNYETQIGVVKKLIDDGWDVQLRIFGKILDESYAHKINGMISEYSLQNNIHILGQIDDNMYKELHKLSDMFLFINIDQSWGLAIFEAQSCGMPVLVSKSVGAVEILNDGEDSIFVEATNVNQICSRIENLALDEERYTQITNKAKEFYKNWTWDKAYSSKMFNLISQKVSNKTK